MSFELIIDKEEVGSSVFMKDLETGCQASVLTYGALLNGFAIPINGEYPNVMDSYADNEDAAANIEAGFKSARLSPFAGRVKKGHYTYNNKDHKLEKFYLSGNAIHGLMYDHQYEIVETKKTISEASVHLKGFYAGNDKGYPYRFLSDITYRLQAGNRLVIETCVEHYNEHPIPYGEGWHPYFQLTGSVDECSLYINSDQRFKADKHVLCNGEKIADDRFIQAAELSGISLDDCFELKNNKGVAAILKDDVLQLKVEVWEGYPFLQVFTPDHRNSIAIECMSMLPDAFNHGIGLMILEPKKRYRFVCSYSLQQL